MGGLTEAGCLLDPAYDRRKSTVLPLRPEFNSAFRKSWRFQQVMGARWRVSTTSVAGSKRSGGGCRLGVADIGRQRHADRLEGLAGNAGHRRAQDEALAVLRDLDLLQPVEVGQQVAPLRLEPSRRQSVFQLAQ